MTRSEEGAPEEVADWSRGGPPRSRRHGDVYFSAEDGLAESRAVFLGGCGLPEAWTARASFCVGELGFGTGLNIAALLHLWRRSAAPDAILRVFTVENDLMTAQEAARALAGWPELCEIAALLTSRWPGRARGFRRIDLPELRATVDLAQMEAAAALEAWSGTADAWFLDGFSPAADPGIWRGEVMSLVARRSAPGARAATFTVAGAVRRALAEAGFEVARRPGHGRKRERLEARLAGAPAPASPPPRIAVIGAGIAGAAVCRALAAAGAQPRLFEAHRPGAGASGVPAALAGPRLDAGLGPIAELFAQAAARASDLYLACPNAVLARGVIQLPSGPRDRERFAAVAASDLFARSWLTPLDPEAAADRLGEPSPPALDLAGAVAVDPAAVLAAWTPPTKGVRVGAVERGAEGWRLLDAEGAALAQADAVCLAAGASSAQLARTLAPGLALTPVRGQATLALGKVAPAASFGGYVVGGPAGALFGATHDRGDADPAPRPADDARNLESLAQALPVLAAGLAGAPLTSWAGVRATTTDYLPVAGALAAAAPGLFILGGLGSRGFCLAPLLGEHLAALMLGAPSPLPRTLAALVDPGRFAARAARRGPSRP